MLITYLTNQTMPEKMSTLIRFLNKSEYDLVLYWHRQTTTYETEESFGREE